MRSAVRLRIVRGAPTPERVTPDAAPDRGDVLLLAVLLLLNVIPVAGELAGIGRWSPATVGFAAGAVLLVARALWSELGACARAKTARKEKA